MNSNISTPLLEALGLLRDAAKTMIISAAFALIAISMIISLPSAITSILVQNRGFGLGIIAWIILAAIFLIVSVILIFTSIHRLIASVNYFSAYKGELTSVKNYVIWGFMGGPILMVIGTIVIVVSIFTMSTAVVAGFTIILIGVFLLWLGGIGLSALCFKLYEEFKSVLMVVSGIFFLLMSALSLISWVLIHIENDALMRRIAGAPVGPSGTVTLPPPP
ncbi:MAG: DUF973 family protein [Thermoproteota archaeon]